MLAGCFLVTFAAFQDLRRERTGIREAAAYRPFFFFFEVRFLCNFTPRLLRLLL